MDGQIRGGNTAQLVAVFQLGVRMALCHRHDLGVSGKQQLMRCSTAIHQSKKQKSRESCVAAPMRAHSGCLTAYCQGSTLLQLGYIERAGDH